MASVSFLLISNTGHMKYAQSILEHIRCLSSTSIRPFLLTHPRTKFEHIYLHMALAATAKQTLM